MGKVTYIFGAGASCKCLPLVKDMPERLKEFRAFIVHNRVSRNEPFPNLGPGIATEADGENLFLAECAELIEQSKIHASIDTYAKKLFLTQQNEKLKAVKVILCCFFIYEQLSKPEDKRYDTFFASILKTSTAPPDNIRIVTWNYDFQFEKAYSKYSLTKDLEKNQQHLKIFPSEQCRVDKYSDGFGIFKYNGTTGFLDLGRRDLNNIFWETREYENPELVTTFIWYFLAYTQARRISVLLKFAWEHNIVKPELTEVKLGAQATQNSNAIVIIGYSFPFFNRDIDKFLMKNATSANPIIYVQDTRPDKILVKLSSVLPDHIQSKIIPIQVTEDDEEFFLPPEL